MHSSPGVQPQTAGPLLLAMSGWPIATASQSPRVIAFMISAVEILP
jgi:hypothetical protein